MPRLKVFCASSGFHDAVVAAPSKPAALKAWGAKTDLFSMGVARLVTDPAITRKALERPGEAALTMWDDLPTHHTTSHPTESATIAGMVSMLGLYEITAMVIIVRKK